MCEENRAWDRSLNVPCFHFVYNITANFCELWVSFRKVTLSNEALRNSEVRKVLEEGQMQTHSQGLISHCGTATKTMWNDENEKDGKCAKCMYTVIFVLQYVICQFIYRTLPKRENVHLITTTTRWKDQLCPASCYIHHWHKAKPWMTNRQEAELL